MSRSPYQILGVAPGASSEEIRKAYRRKALELHPDRNPDDPTATERFKDLQEAYAALRESRRTGVPRPPAPARGWSMDATEAELRDLFRTLFEADRAFATPREMVIELTLADVACGTTREFVWRYDATCTGCDGAPLEPCTRCFGTGVVGAQRRFRVRIPAGVEEGTRLRIMPPGDSTTPIWLVVAIGPDPCFARRGADLDARVEIDPAVFDIGGTVHIATPSGRTLAVRVPRGSTPGQILRLRGQGLPQGQVVGDLYLELALRTATAKTRKPAMRRIRIRTPRPRRRKAA